jgi:hypothetical protein
MLGKERRDAERPLRLAVEAVVGRLGDIATKLPDEVTEATPEIPRREVVLAGTTPPSWPRALWPPNRGASLRSAAHRDADVA